MLGLKFIHVSKRGPRCYRLNSGALNVKLLSGENHWVLLIIGWSNYVRYGHLTDINQEMFNLKWLILKWNFKE